MPILFLRHSYYLRLFTSARHSQRCPQTLRLGVAAFLEGISHHYKCVENLFFLFFFFFTCKGILILGRGKEPHKTKRTHLQCCPSAFQRSNKIPRSLSNVEFPAWVSPRNFTTSLRFFLGLFHCRLASVNSSAWAGAWRSLPRTCCCADLPDEATLSPKSRIVFHRL